MSRSSSDLQYVLLLPLEPNPFEKVNQRSSSALYSSEGAVELKDATKFGTVSMWREIYTQTTSDNILGRSLATSLRHR